jgi:hypothetical protein
MKRLDIRDMKSRAYTEVMAKLKILKNNAKRKSVQFAKQ